MPVALVTGASRGFGLALADALADLGWTLVLDARTAAPLAAAADRLRVRTDVHTVAGDVADAAHRRELADVVGDLGRLDLLVNNAGILGPSPQPPLAAYPLDVLDEVYRVNVFAPLALTQTLLPALREAHGTVVDIVSDAAFEPYEGWGGYGSAKAALAQLTAVLGAEEPDVRVYAYDPGDMRTRMHQEAFPGEDISDRPDPQAAVPDLLRLLERDAASGAYRVGSVEEPVAGGTR